jgi:hypothetical protein
MIAHSAMTRDAGATEALDPSGLAGQQQLVADVVLLLDYLSRVSGARLDWCFDDTRGLATAAPVRIATPPVASKVAFVDAVMAAAFAVRQAAAAAGADGAGPLPAEQVSFLIRARDFLSVVAQPASVESIRVTHAYCEERARHRSLRGRVAALFASGAAPAGESRALYYGRKVAQRRNRYQALLIGLALITIWLSFQTLVGQGLLREHARLQAAWQAHVERTAKAMQEEAGSFAARQVMTDAERQPGRAGEPARPAGVLRYCDYARIVPGLRPAGEELPVVVAGPGAPAAQAERLPLFVSARHQALCDERAELGFRATRLAFVYGEWWSGLAPVIGLMRLPGELWRGGYAIACRGVEALGDGLLHGLGGSPQPADSTCRRAPPRNDLPAASAATPAVVQLDVHSLGSGMFTDGLLEHILPCLYAMLGALAAMFRRLTSRLAEETISVADFGEMRMTLILGVLAGAVIGLFSGYLGQGTDSSTHTLTVAGLALLAGYGVDRLFGLFDAASSRIFGGGDGTAPGRAAA